MKTFDLSTGQKIPVDTLDPRLTPELRGRCEELVEELHRAGFNVCLALDSGMPTQVPTWVLGDSDTMIVRLERTIHVLRQRLRPWSILSKTFGGRRG